jgi:mRNA interferase RelE/StbE
LRTYSLEFLKKAEREWNRLGATIRAQFASKLAERLANPEVPKDKLRGYAHLYKIKLKNAGYRLIYDVDGDRVAVVVIKIAERERGKAYDGLGDRLREARRDRG